MRWPGGVDMEDVKEMAGTMSMERKLSLVLYLC
jgi:hypothetical protein